MLISCHVLGDRVECGCMKVGCGRWRRARAELCGAEEGGSDGETTSIESNISSVRHTLQKESLEASTQRVAEREARKGQPLARAATEGAMNSARAAAAVAAHHGPMLYIGTSYKIQVIKSNFARKFSRNPTLGTTQPTQPRSLTLAPRDAS